MWFVTVGLWGVAAVLLLGAGVALAPTRPYSATVGRQQVTEIAGWLVVPLLAIRALPTLAQDIFTEAGVLPSPAHSTNGWAVIHWRLALWTPWFVLGAVLFALAVVGYHRTSRLDSDRDPEWRVL